MDIIPNKSPQLFTDHHKDPHLLLLISTITDLPLSGELKCLDSFPASTVDSTWTDGDIVVLASPDDSMIYCAVSVGASDWNSFRFC